jgi:hypothetical protein
VSPDEILRSAARLLRQGAPVEEFVGALDEEARDAVWAALGPGRTAWIVEVESPGEWQSVESVHATEAGARAAAERRRASYESWPRRSRVVHVSDSEVRP